VSLQEGCLASIMVGNRVQGPVLQVLEIRTQKVSNSTTEKYTVVLSDGVNTQLAFLATQCNSAVTNGSVGKFYIVRLTEYCLSKVGQRTCLIIAKIQPIEACSAQIGSPTPLSVGPSSSVAPGSSGIPRPVPGISAVSDSPVKQQPQAITSPVKSPPRPGAAAAGAALKTGPAGNEIPVKVLHPFMPSWAIRVCVESKSDMREFQGKKGPGKLFSMDLIDAEGTEIRATAFNEEVDKFYDLLQKGHSYIIHRGALKPANKKFTTIPHPYEITLNQNTTITPVEESGAEPVVPHVQYKITPLDVVGTMERDSMCTVMGILTEVGPLQDINIRKTGKVQIKRSFSIVDTSGRKIEISAWGEAAKDPSFEGVAEGTVVIVKDCSVSDFNGKSLTLRGNSALIFSPDTPDARALSDWYRDAQTHGVMFLDLTTRTGGDSAHPDVFKTLKQVQDEQVGMHEEPEFFTCVGCISRILHSGQFFYQSCPASGCGAKVEMQTGGEFYCKKCNKSYSECKQRYMLPVTIQDSTGSIYATCFNEVAEQIMKHPASDIAALATPDGQVIAEQYFQDAQYSFYKMRIKGFADKYNDVIRPRYSVIKIDPLDPINEIQRILTNIEALQA